MKISIIGLPASGKTALAHQISKKFGIPHIHLDRFWFEAGGLYIDRNAPEAERDRVRDHVKQRALESLDKESWVSDGFYSRSVGPEIAKRADAILFLDISLWRRLLNHLRRIFKRSTRHQELNMWHEIKFFPEIVRRTYANDAKLRKFILDNKDKVVILRSRREMVGYLQKLT